MIKPNIITIQFSSDYIDILCICTLDTRLTCDLSDYIRGSYSKNDFSIRTIISMNFLLMPPLRQRQ